MVLNISDSENLVLREVFKGKELKEILDILNTERKQWAQAKQDERMKKEVDIRSVSKFKSLAIWRTSRSC